MCELFGICSREKVVINHYLKEFYSHSIRHPHGWGLACLEGNEAVIEKEPVQATKSNYLKERLSQTISVRTAFAHIRYATIGNVGYQNCHPYSGKDFSGRHWTLIHNGTIFDYAPLNKYVASQEGDTDSERILLYILEQMNKEIRSIGRAPDGEERFRLLDVLVTEMAKGNKLNFLLFDGEQMYVHTNYKNSLYFLEEENCLFFSTNPLDQEDWQPVPFTRLLVYREGSLIREGTEHHREYVDSEENMKFLYQIFSDL